MSSNGSAESDVYERRNITWTIRPMIYEDIDKCLVIWSQVELTEAYQTVASCLASDPSGFYVAELNDTGEVIGMCAGPMVRTDTAFMGFYAVEPRFQGLGIGRELWNRTIGRLDPSINIGLYGVPAMSEKYKRTGFALEDATRMLIFESEPEGESKLKIDQLKDLDSLVDCHLEVVNSEMSEMMFKKLIAYDQSVQRFSREKLLRLYLAGDDVPLTLAIVKDNSRARVCTHPACGQHHVGNQIYAGERKSSCCAKPSQESIIEDETLSTGIKSSLSISASNLGELPVKSTSPIDIRSVVGGCCGGSKAMHLSGADQVTNCDDLQANNYEILGYGCIRYDNNSGGMIGPIYADSSDLCEIILKNLIDRFRLKSGNIYSVMALSSNKQACKILSKIGLNEMDQCSRMFTKFVPAASFSKIYYVHSPNFTLF